MQIEEQAFRRIVASALKNLSIQVDAVDSDEIDAKFTDGVLQVEFESGGVFVLSQQVPVRELWLSAFSRAWHFRYADGRWPERDHGTPLEQVLGEIFTKRLGKAIAFTNPG
jgi:iron donor protein CyaY